MIEKIALLFRSNKILIAILIVATLFRFIGTNPGYNQYHSDQGISYSAAVSMIKNGNFDPLRYDYPALVPDINYIFFRAFFIPLGWTRYYLGHIPEIIDGIVHIPIAPLEAKRVFQVEILKEREINAIFWSRYITAIFGIGAVFLTFLLTKRLFAKTNLLDGYVIGLIAAFLLTFNYKHVTNSHLGLPDIYNAFFLLLATFAALSVWRNPSHKNYLFAGITAGLSFSVKYQFFAFFPLGMVLLYNSFKNNRLNLKLIFSPITLLAIVPIPLVFALTNPYFFIHIDEAIAAVKDVSQKYGMGTNRINLYPLWYMYNIDYGIVQMAAMLMGLFVALRRYMKESLLLLSILVPFAFVFFYYSRGGFYVRNFISITPFLMMFAAIGIWFVYSLLEKMQVRVVAKLVLVLLLFLSIVVPGRNALVNVYYYTKPWGYGVLRQWAQEHLASNAKVAAHPFDGARAGVKLTRSEFEIAGSYSLAEHRENGAEYALINLDWAGNSFYFWMNFGPEDVGAYWNKPWTMMRNTYHGIAAEELFRYQIFSTAKPWQAPDSALIMAKIPVWPTPEMSSYASFNFDEDSQGWIVYGANGQDKLVYQHDSTTGYIQNGSLLFQPLGVRYPGVRMTSQPIPVKSGFLYKVRAFLKTRDVLDASQRDGFLRVDFYSEEPELNQVGLIASVSSRVYGTTEWVERQIVERAPQEARFMTVSFGIYQYNKTAVWLDDIVIEESLIPVDDITALPPYSKKHIDLNLLYPNSHGNL